MRKITMAAALAAALLASGCATYQAGNASQSDLLKRFEPIPGKGSVYLCRIPALLFPLFSAVALAGTPLPDAPHVVVQAKDW